jgi:hypothetical protein
MGTVKEVIEAFDRQEFTEVQQLIKKIRDNTFVSSTNFQPNDPITKQAEIDRAFPYLQDITNGPISKGIETLKAITMVINGSSYTGMQKFNIYSFVHTPDQFKLANEISGAILVVDTLNMRQYYDLLRRINKTEYNDFVTFLTKIFKLVKSGSFDKDALSNFIKIKCKRVIKICVNYRQVV